MANSTEKTFLVSLNLQESCSCRALAEVDKQLYESVKSSKKAYSYNTLELHDKSYMVIKVWAEDGGQEEWLSAALKNMVSLWILQISCSITTCSMLAVLAVSLPHLLRRGQGVGQFYTQPKCHC